MLEYPAHASAQVPAVQERGISLRNPPAAGFQKGPLTIVGIERIFGVTESFFRYFWNTLKVLEYFLDVF